MSKQRHLHCWADKFDDLRENDFDAYIERSYVNDEPDGTCMLEAGHDGEHEFTPDDQIVIGFKEAKL